MKVLLADDEKTIAITLGDALKGAGHNVTVVSDGEQALRALSGDAFECVITDIRMPKVDGLTVLKKAKEVNPEAAVILVSAYGSPEQSFQYAKDGADDFLTKPFFNEDVLFKLEKLAKMRTLTSENRLLKEQIGQKEQFGRLIGKSPKMQALYELINNIAASDSNVLIEGENGTGKELVAQQIHYNSARRNAPVEVISIASQPESLVEDVLFGHVKGAFTDARSDRAGKFEAANGGSIFIDDIDDMPIQSQVKLLRVLQERQVERIGDTKLIKVDVRIIVATKVDLWTLVQQEKFREDLFQRLRVLEVKIPPLRERHGDIPILVAHFVEKYGKGAAYTVPPDVMEALEKYSWPGNVRELEHSIERAMALAGADKTLKKSDALKPLPIDGSEVPLTGKLSTLDEVRREAEVRHIKSVVAYTKGHKGEAARICGITRKSLWEKMREYGIEA